MPLTNPRVVIKMNLSILIMMYIVGGYMVRQIVNKKEDLEKTRLNILKPTNLYTEAKRRYDELIKIRQNKEKAVANAPKGKIHIVKSPKRIQFYLRQNKNDKSGLYVSKSEHLLIKKYLQKAYDEKVLKAINQEISVISKFLEKSNKSTQQIPDLIRQFYSENPNEVKKFIIPIDLSDEDYKKVWLSFQYEGKEIPDDAPIYKTDKKEIVRSKSELNIANMLNKYGIPYRYECPLYLENKIVFYPDFTILNVKRRKVFYWEHRGMMDNVNYASNAVKKNKIYMDNGIIIGNNLIISEETSTNPLGTNEIELIIKEYLL